MKVTPGWPMQLHGLGERHGLDLALASSTICCTVFFILSGIGCPPDAYVVLVRPRQVGSAFDFAQGRGVRASTDFEFRAREPELRQALLEIVAEQRLAQQIGGDAAGVLALRLRRAWSFQSSIVPSPRPSHSRPIRSAFSSSPSSAMKARELLLRRDCRECSSSTSIIAVVGWRSTRLRVGRHVLHVEFARLDDHEADLLGRNRSMDRPSHAPLTPAYLRWATDLPSRNVCSASQTSGLPSEGARQSPRGDSEPPDEIFGPLGNAERLNWLAKKRRRNSSSQRWISASRIGALRRRPARSRARRPCSTSCQAFQARKAILDGR